MHNKSIPSLIHIVISFKTINFLYISTLHFPKGRPLVPHKALTTGICQEF